MTRPSFVVYALVKEVDSPAGKIPVWVDSFHTRADANYAKADHHDSAKLKVRRATLTLFET